MSGCLAVLSNYPENFVQLWQGTIFLVLIPSHMGSLMHMLMLYAVNSVVYNLGIKYSLKFSWTNLPKKIPGRISAYTVSDDLMAEWHFV